MRRWWIVAVVAGLGGLAVAVAWPGLSEEQRSIAAYYQGTIACYEQAGTTRRRAEAVETAVRASRWRDAEAGAHVMRGRLVRLQTCLDRLATSAAGDRELSPHAREVAEGAAAYATAWDLYLVAILDRRSDGLELARPHLERGSEQVAAANRAIDRVMTSRDPEEIGREVDFERLRRVRARALEA